MRHARDPTGQTQEVLPSTAVLVCNEQALVGGFALKGPETRLGLGFIPSGQIPTELKFEAYENKSSRN